LGSKLQQQQKKIIQPVEKHMPLKGVGFLRLVGNHVVTVESQQDGSRFLQAGGLVFCTTTAGLGDGWGN